MEKLKQKWYQKDFMDNTFEKKYIGDFEFYKKLNRNYNNIQEKAIRFNNEENQLFIAKCLDGIMLAEWETTNSELWKIWKEKRFELNRRVEYETKCCWNTIVKNAKPELVGNCLALIRKGLKDFRINEQIAVNWLKELMKWDRKMSEICDVDTQKKIYCIVRKDFLPIIYLEKQRFKLTDEKNKMFMEKCRNRMGQILFKAAMNIGDELISQIDDEKILNDIELLDILVLIEKRIQEPFESVEDPEIEKNVLLRPFIEMLLNVNEIDIKSRCVSINKKINSN
jgi:hypothetical protein